MKIDWKGLKQQKQEELPEAELKRISQAEKDERYFQKELDRCEKRLFKMCCKQEAGTTIEYGICRIHSTTTFALFMAFLHESSWLDNEEFKSRIIDELTSRLRAQGIKVEKVEGWHEIKVTLP